MPQVYEVQYQINVNNGPALEAIRQFQDATTKMEQLVGRFDAISKGIGKVNSVFNSLNKTVSINIKTDTAERDLNRVIGLLNQIKTLSSSVLAGNIRVAGGGGKASGSTNPATYLTNLSASIAQAHKSIDGINKRYINPKAQTGRAIRSLDALIAKINEVKGMSNITVTASAAGASKAAGRTASSAIQTVRVAPQRGAGHSTYLYPSTRQVLGPTYAQTGTNVAGEMIKGMGVAYGLSALMSGISGVFRDASNYENISMTTRNILGAHDNRPTFSADFEQMNQLMRQVGVETKFTAPEVASAGKFLAMAGYRTDDIRNAIRPISSLALIGDANLGETADVVTNIMTGYEIPADQMRNVADILTMTFTKSNTTLMELAESFKYAGTIAKQSGMEFETTAAAIGVLGDAGIKASHAGTTLRMMLMNMQAPTKKQKAAWDALGISPKDANGNLKDFNTLMSELNKKSKEMSGGDFTSLFYQAFRVTAATGAMALVRNADKLQEVSDLNKTGSYGLSEKLSEAKKNTIEGLWYQMTSAFTESGMKGFEQIQSAIRAFLQKMIQLMKSPEFVEALSSAMQMFMRLVEVITGVFKKIMGIWNWLPNWAKDGIVYFVKIQMTFGIIAATAQSFLSTWIMIRGVMMGDWLSKALLKPLATVVVYATQLYNIQRNILGLSRGRAFLGMLGGSWTRVKRIGKHALSGLMGTGTSTSVMGSTVAAGATNFTGTIAKLGGASLLSAGAMLGFWSVVGTAAAYAGYQIYDTIQVTNEARRANEAWAASYKNLGIAKLDMSDPDSLAIGNMRIFTSELLDQSEKLRLAGDMWHRYWQEKNGLSQPQNDNSKVADVDENFKKNLEAADAWFNVSGAYTPIIKALGGKIESTYTPPVDSRGPGMWAYSTNLYGRNFSWTNDMNENTAVQFALAQLGANYENKERKQWEKYLLTAATRANSYQDLQTVINGIRNEIDSRQWDAKWDNISSENAAEMTWDNVTHSQMYILALRDQMKAVFNSWNDFGDILKDADEGKDVDAERLQRVLFQRISPLLDPRYGLFGTDSWVQNLKKIYDNPAAFGLAGMDVAGISGRITDTFDAIINFYNTLDNKYKPLFAQYLNRSPFEEILKDGYSLGAGGFTGGSKEGDKMVGADGKTYTWTKHFSGPDGKFYFMWQDKDGNKYNPQDTKATWSPDKDGSNDLSDSLHNGTDQSEYKSHYNQSSAPKQVIVNIENLMRVDKQTIDLTDGRQTAAVMNMKQQIAVALLDVVQDFNAQII